jgi:hypothetical protein
MTPEEIRKVIESTKHEDDGKGRMFEVTFRRRNDSRDGTAKAGDIRVLRGRLGMKYAITDEGKVKKVNGKGMSYEPKSYDLMTVREANGGFRSIPLDTVVSLRVPDNSKHLIGVPV